MRLKMSRKGSREQDRMADAGMRGLSIHPPHDHSFNNGRYLSIFPSGFLFSRRGIAMIIFAHGIALSNYHTQFAFRLKALGIDYGEARVGVACSDDIGMLAHPVETIEVSRIDPINRIVEISAERGTGIIVIGMPYRLDGSRGSAAVKVEKFMARLARALPDHRVNSHDERLTTITAQGKLHAAGRTVKDSRAIIDQAAAMEILQSYLDEQAR